MEEQSLETISIFLLGDNGVGKTSFLLRIFSDYSSSCYLHFMEHYQKKVKITINQHTKLYNLQIWDTDGKYKKDVITWIKLVRAKGILLFYDITRKSTFDNLHDWFTDLNFLQPKIPIFIIGAKENDFMNREIRNIEKILLASQYKCLHFYSYNFEENDINIIKCMIKEILYPSHDDYWVPYLTDTEIKNSGVIISPAEDAIFLSKKKTNKNKKCIY